MPAAVRNFPELAKNLPANILHKQIECVFGYFLLFTFRILKFEPF